MPSDLAYNIDLKSKDMGCFDFYNYTCVKMHSLFDMNASKRHQNKKRGPNLEPL